MKARELAILLEHVDPEVEIHIIGNRGWSCHVDLAWIQPARRQRWNNGFPDARYQAGDVIHSSLRLEGRTLWFDPEPRFELRGRFRGAALLDRQLDPEVPS